MINNATQTWIYDNKFDSLCKINSQGQRVYTVRSLTHTAKLSFMNADAC